MYELNEATCDGCRTIFRAINKKHYCPHCDKYFYICNRCQEKGAHCPDCGVSLKKRTPPLKDLKKDFGVKNFPHYTRWNLGQRQSRKTG